jgi:3-phenylpropionate/trans-cinnamate dioxygenase ferredoxin component
MSFNYAELEADRIEYVPVATPEEIPNGSRMFVEIDQHNIVVFNIAGKFFAIADVCSHDDGPVGDGEVINEYEVVCPRHGAKFDIRNGEVRGLPAIVDIPAYPVREIGGQVEVGIPLE